MENNKIRNQILSIVYMAMYVALFAALDYFTRFLPRMSSGGSFGLGTIALLLSSYHLGWKKGVMISLISIPVQFMVGSSPAASITGFILDYLIGYGVYGLASLLPNFGLVYTGIIVTNLIRWMASTLSGVLVWETELWASMVYNATYLLPTLVVGFIVVPLLFKGLNLEKNQ